MENKAADTIKNEVRTDVEDFVRAYFALFIEDYPNNREIVLGVFDEGIKRTPRPKVKEFWAKLKDEFLEAEKTF